MLPRFYFRILFQCTTTTMVRSWFRLNSFYISKSENNCKDQEHYIRVALPSDCVCRFWMPLMRREVRAAIKYRKRHNSLFKTGAMRSSILSSGKIWGHPLFPIWDQYMARCLQMVFPKPVVTCWNVSNLLLADKRLILTPKHMICYVTGPVPSEATLKVWGILVLKGVSPRATMDWRHCRKLPNWKKIIWEVKRMRWKRM